MNTRFEIARWVVGFLSLTYCLGNNAFTQQVSADDDFRTLSGKHIDLTTDLADTAAAQVLVDAFDAAVPQWGEFWKIDADTIRDWRVTAYVMDNPRRFQSAGLISPRVPKFDYGYALGNRLWIIAQPGDYYTRHLLLHEGVHSLMFDQYGGAGPSWFMEGTAELLSTHSGSGADVKIGQIPADRDAAVYWGRFKAMAEGQKASGTPTIESVLRYPAELHGDVESYGWSWAAAMLMTEYPEYRQTFVQSAKLGRDKSSRFTRQLHQRLQPSWPFLVARWRVMSHELDYGFEWRREKIEISRRDTVWDGSTRLLTVAADAGWQSTGQRYSPGMIINVTAEGQCVVANSDDPDNRQSPEGERDVVTPAKSAPWISEPQGITIEYHRGRPLGQLLVCQLPLLSKSQPTTEPLKVEPVGNGTRIEIEGPCWLLFRINEAAAGLADNNGGYSVTLTKGQ